MQEIIELLERRVEDWEKIYKSGFEGTEKDRAVAYARAYEDRYLIALLKKSLLKGKG